MRSDRMISTSDGDGGENSLESIAMMTHFPLVDEGEESRRSAANSVLGSGLLSSLFGGFLRSHPPPALPPPAMQNEETQSASAEPTDQRQEDDAGVLDSNTNEGEDQSSPQGGDSRRLSKASLQVISAALKQGLTNGTRTETLVDYHKSEFKRYWMPDSTGKECYDCRERFTVFNRRHHCRLCGQIFCAKCSNQHVDGTKLGYSGVLRLCALCVKQVDTYTSGRTLASGQVGLPMDLMEAEGAGSCGEEPGDEDDIPPPPSPRPSERSLNTNHYSITSRTGEEFPDANEENEWRDVVGPAVEPRHRRAGSNQSEDHLHQPFKACIRRMLVDLLRREQLCDDKWSDFLLSLAYKLVEIIYPMVMRRTEALSPLDFVHIKKLALSNIDIPSHEIIRGPAFTKSLHNSAMPSSAKNVSIMLLGGNVSYERVTEKFTPVETVLLQEREYLKIQVERVTSRRVTLLLVENSVATSAADMLLEEGISLVTNVRRKVLELIARCVGADIITSLHGAQFLQPKIGFAPDFRQREFALVDNEKKFILTLDNCMGDGGISILLKGGSLREVAAAKRLLRFLITAIFSSRLEISFLALFNSIPPSLNEDEEGDRPTASQCEICHLNAAAEDIASQSPSPFVEALREVQLSNSPAISFSPPFLESEAGHSCYLVPYFKSNLFPLFHAQDFERCAELSAEKRTRQAIILEEYRERRHENSRLRHAMLNEAPMDVKALMSISNWAAYRSRSALLFRRRYEKNRAAHSEKSSAMAVLDVEYQKPLGESEPSNPVTSPGDVLNPYNRQRIAFLYCANLRKPTTTTARSFCIGPYVLQRQFFSSRSKDTSLGAFLVGYCFNVDYKCKGCDRSMTEHLRRIVHRHVRIEISTSVLLKSGAVGEDFTASEELPSAIPNTNWASIICWRRCAICLSNSSITSMPDSVYHLSFAKFIDYLGNGTHWTSAIPSSLESSGKCPHCTFHQHWHYFALRNSVTCFKVHPIRPLHVLLSPMCCRIISKELACKELLEILGDLETLADEIFEKALAHVTDHHSGSDEVIEELRTFVDQYRTTFNYLKKFDPDGVFKTSASVQSSDFYYIQSSCCLVRCRCFLHSFITKWNAKPANELSHNKSSIFSRRDASSGNLLLDNFLHTASSTAALLLNPSGKEESSQHSDGEAKPGEHAAENQSLGAKPETVSTGMADSQAKRAVADLPFLPSPLPRDMHYDLPMNPSTILVRDLLDVKGSILGPDIGSVVAYTLASSEYEEKKLSAAITTNGAKMNGGCEQGEVEQSCEITFADARAHYCIRVYFPERFEHIRGITFGDGEEQFIRSLSRTSAWNPQGGKSGAVFYRTEDERFIIKQMSRLELESFKKCGLKYIEYVNVAANERKLSALCKIYGVYSVHYANKVSGSSMKMDVLIMEYLFYGKQVKQLWDLKGSLRNRYATTKTETPVLLDENLAQDLWRNQLYIHPHSKAALNKAIVNDSHFLCSQGIMDYSLLAGICHDNDEVVIGIVDYMRTYTLDKKVESLVKTALPIAHSPTVVSPELYCKRFYDSIDNYFAMSPDQWTSSDPFFD